MSKNAWLPVTSCGVVEVLMPPVPSWSTQGGWRREGGAAAGSRRQERRCLAVPAALLSSCPPPHPTSYPTTHLAIVTVAPTVGSATRDDATGLREESGVGLGVGVGRAGRRGKMRGACVWGGGVDVAGRDVGRDAACTARHTPRRRWTPPPLLCPLTFVQPALIFKKGAGTLTSAGTLVEVAV